LVGLLVKDAMDDFRKEFEEAFAAVGEARKIIAKKASDVASILVEEVWSSVLDGTF